MCHTWLQDKFDDVFNDVIALNNENDKCFLVSFAWANPCFVKLSWELKHAHRALAENLAFLFTFYRIETVTICREIQI